VDFFLADAHHLLVELAKLGNPKSRKTKPDDFQMSEIESEILTLEEVAAYLKAGKRTVYRLAQKGEIPAFKLGGTWRFRRSDLDRWIAERINKKKPEAE
jgi:excisionase family DNA binding protein